MNKTINEVIFHSEYDDRTWSQLVAEVKSHYFAFAFDVAVRRNLSAAYAKHIAKNPTKKNYSSRAGSLIKRHVGIRAVIAKTKAMIQQPEVSNFQVIWSKIVSKSGEEARAANQYDAVLKSLELIGKHKGMF